MYLPLHFIQAGIYKFLKLIGVFLMSLEIQRKYVKVHYGFIKPRNQIEVNICAIKARVDQFINTLQSQKEKI